MSVYAAVLSKLLGSFCFVILVEEEDDDDGGGDDNDIANSTYIKFLVMFMKVLGLYIFTLFYLLFFWDCLKEDLKLSVYVDSVKEYITVISPFLYYNYCVVVGRGCVLLPMNVSASKQILGFLFINPNNAKIS